MVKHPNKSQPDPGAQAVGTPCIVHAKGQNSTCLTNNYTFQVRSADGAGLVPWSLTEVNGRPLSLFAKEAEAVERLGATVGCREVSVVVQPADFVVRMRKQMKGNVRGYKDFLLN